MDWKTFGLVFGTVFMAELGDKTQLATLLFAANGEHARLTVFLGAAAALVVAAGIGVLAGSVLADFVSPRHLSIVAGIGFLVIGAWTLWQGVGGG